MVSILKCLVLLNQFIHKPLCSKNHTVAFYSEQRKKYCIGEQREEKFVKIQPIIC